MGTFSIWHWLVVLAIVLVIFGTKKLRNIGSDVGGAIKNFKDAMKSEQEAGKQEGASEEKKIESRVVEGEVTGKRAEKAEKKKA